MAEKIHRNSLKAGYQFDRPMAFVDVVGDTHFSNGKKTGMVRNGAVRSWGVEVPAGTPTLAAAAGSLHPGDYHVTVGFVRDDGEVSGAPEFNSITLTAAGGIALSNIPQPVEADVAAIRIYMTAANGDELYTAKVLLVGVTNYTITSADLTVPFRYYLCTPPPPGDILELYNGRIFIADGKYLYFTMPHAYGLCKSYKDFFRFSQDIDMVGAVEDGLYVSADKIYFIPFTKVAEAQPILKAPYKAIKGTMARSNSSVMNLESDGEVIAFYTEQGMCVGANSGQFLNLTYDKYVPQDAASPGSAIIREEDGVSQYVALVPKGEDNGRLYASDIAVAEIVRNGVVIN